MPRTDCTQIHAALEHSSKTGQTDLTVTCRGDRFDPRQTDNKLSLAVLRSTAEEIRYSYDPDSEEPNRVVLLIKRETTGL